ncbi:MAG: hypothetical protein JXA71_18010, partial [Chitinispirillaceae bacterium]|nr:hypothetical protein [Chitinispirillaceae bacterium]
AGEKTVLEAYDLGGRKILVIEGYGRLMDVAPCKAVFHDRIRMVKCTQGDVAVSGMVLIRSPGH